MANQYGAQLAQARQAILQALLGAGGQNHRVLRIPTDANGVETGEAPITVAILTGIVYRAHATNAGLVIDIPGIVMRQDNLRHFVGLWYCGDSSPREGDKLIVDGQPQEIMAANLIDRIVFDITLKD